MAAIYKKLGSDRKCIVKLSEVFRRVDGKIPLDLGVYRGTLDELYSTFGEDRVLVWQRLAKQRQLAAVCGRVASCAGILRGEDEGGRGEIFLEERDMAYAIQPRRV